MQTDIVHDIRTKLTGDVWMGSYEVSCICDKLPLGNIASSDSAYAEALYLWYVMHYKYYVKDDPS